MKCYWPDPFTNIFVLDLYGNLLIGTDQWSSCILSMIWTTSKVNSWVNKANMNNGCTMLTTLVLNSFPFWVRVNITSNTGLYIIIMKTKHHYGDIDTQQG